MLLILKSYMLMFNLRIIRSARSHTYPPQHALAGQSQRDSESPSARTRRTDDTSADRGDDLQTAVKVVRGPMLKRVALQVAYYFSDLICLISRMLKRPLAIVVGLWFLVFLVGISLRAMHSNLCSARVLSSSSWCLGPDASRHVQSREG